MSKCVFEYRYRDAGNWKTEGTVILSGQADAALVEAIRQSLESDELFVPEQVGLDPLQNEHVLAHKCGYDDDLDHAFHEFIGVRAIDTANETQHATLATTLESLADRFKAARKQGWNVSLSPFGER